MLTMRTKLGSSEEVNKWCKEVRESVVAEGLEEEVIMQKPCRLSNGVEKKDQRFD